MISKIVFSVESVHSDSLFNQYPRDIYILLAYFVMHFKSISITYSEHTTEKKNTYYR